MLQNFIDTPIMIGSFYFYSEEDMLNSVEHHRQVTQAIKRRNRAYAEQAMAYHLGVSFMRFEMQRVSAAGPATPDSAED
jgi:DNA-binding GntR family transcriptional regulator